MTAEFQILLLTAASLGFVHTILGPDHYLPFVAISKARDWSVGKTIWWTFVCGTGHVLSSVIIGLVGIAIGSQLENLVMIEEFRDGLAAWGLIAFGLIYAVWGMRYWAKQKQEDIKDTQQGKRITPWVLFIIFILGPCEVLIPVLMYPAANASAGALVSVSLVFGVSTLLTMMGAVFIMIYGLRYVSFKPLEKYSHTIAGLVIFLSGMAIEVLGL
ncbi:urease accessory protein UreH domain-containing protein [Natronoflexus pectinivorans]|uniref:Cytochrome C biogenesis DsbD-like protein n=1 Tax=Natronoflexus pectinivorans TaxID=682526 RepID=A0A4R2GNM7_9BACT|nr:sulfite exporter TauE/SafE family protein [Natronoflexus pectinivorans]TCO09305.1 cytochrome C biogenesis DsbD-like protein [Natronoflexus pectinivorans]